MKLKLHDPHNLQKPDLEQASSLYRQSRRRLETYLSGASGRDGAGENNWDKFRDWRPPEPSKTGPQLPPAFDKGETES